jgi:hypothetical protein
VRRGDNDGPDHAPADAATAVRAFAKDPSVLPVRDFAHAATIRAFHGCGVAAHQGAAHLTAAARRRLEADDILIARVWFPRIQLIICDQASTSSSCGAYGNLLQFEMKPLNFCGVVTAS